MSKPRNFQDEIEQIREQVTPPTNPASFRAEATEALRLQNRALKAALRALYAGWDGNTSGVAQVNYQAFRTAMATLEACEPRSLPWRLFLNLDDDQHPRASEACFNCGAYPEDDDHLSPTLAPWHTIHGTDGATAPICDECYRGAHTDCADGELAATIRQAT